MTTQKLFSEKKNLNMSTKYFLGELKRSWPRMVLYFIIFCLTMIIPLLMQDMEYVTRFDESAEEHLIRNSKSLLNLMEQFSQIWTLVSMGVALFAGCYVTKILNNKISADFYHSLPMRRESIYLTRLSVGFISYFVTFLANVIIVLVLCEAQELAAGYGMMIFKQIMVNFGLSILAFFMIYSVTVFAGMLCGTATMRLLMTLYLCFVAFTYHCSFFGTLELFFDTFNPSYYIEAEGTALFVLKLLPFVRLLSLELIEQISVVDYFFFAFASLALLVGALALYKARKIEKAGTPIVFDGFAAFFRYSVIIPATWLGGIFFYAIVSDFIWYVVGLFLGAFLSFLLLNTILWKNARKMFSGLKGLGIYAAVMLVFFLCIGFDIFGVENYVPKAENVKGVYISLLNQIQEVDFEDRDVIEAAVDLDNSRKNVKGYSGELVSGVSDWVATTSLEMVYAVEGEYPKNDPVFNTDDYDQINYHVVYKMKSGIHIARRVRVMLESDEMTAFAKAVANSEEYEAIWEAHLESIDPNRYYLRYDSITEYNAFDREVIQKFMSEELLRAAKEDFDGIDYQYFQRPQIGRINFYGDYRFDGVEYRSLRQLQAPIFVDDIFAKAHMSGKTIEDYYDYLVSKVMNIVIYTGDKQDFSTEDGISLPKDSELYKEVLKNLANITETRNIFTETESGYHVGIMFSCSEEKYSTGVTYMTAEFLKDSVPSSILTYVQK